MPALCPTLSGEQPLAAARRLRAASPGGAVVVFACFDAALRALPDAGLHDEAAAYAHEVGDFVRLRHSLRAALRIAPTFGDGYFELGNAPLTQQRVAQLKVAVAKC